MNNNQEYDVVKNALSHQSLRATEAAKIRTTRKLNNLHRQGNIVLPNESNHFLNLSDYVLTDDERNILNLGLNCHYQPKFNIMEKKTDLEILYDSLKTLQNNEKISINPNVKDQLRAEGTRQRSNLKSSILTNAQKLKNN